MARATRVAEILDLFFQLSVILKEHKFRKLDLFPSSCESEGEASTQLGPLAYDVQ
jgi:predicted component of type VI protein secretion system